MDFINNTNFHTLIHRTALQNNTIATALMCRITYDVLEDGKTKISDKQDWKLHQTYWESEFGPMDTDDVYTKGGVDVMVFGSAEAPKGKTITEGEVVININNKPIHRIKVFGERKWKSFLGSLSISQPEPFKEIPLTLNNAFGGKSNWDGIEIPYPTNPYGKGYYQTKKEAIGNCLPNIEHFENRIKKWNSWVDPVGVASLSILPYKAKLNLELNENKTNIKKLNAKFFNSAFPELIIKTIKPEDLITINGVTETKDFSLVIPNTELETEITLGDINLNKKLQIDQIGLITDQNKAFITYRLPFKYIIKPMEKREIKLKLIN